MKKITSYQSQHTAFQVMVKPIGPVCNLNCTYCYYLEKENLYSETKDFAMPENVLRTFLRQQIESQTVPVIQIVWQGGEPTLLGVEYFTKATQIAEEIAKENKKRLEHVFQTNATLIDEKWCKFFKQYDVLVGVSIDGPKELHDHYRVNKAGAPTFDRVMKSIRLLKSYDIKFNTLTVVNDHNQHYPLEIYRFLKRIGSGFMQFIPIVEREAENRDEKLQLVSPDYQQEAKVSQWSVNPEKYGDFLIAIFKEWVKTDVGKYFVQIFDATLANWVGEMPGLCVFSDICGDAAAIEHNGDLYSCDHFVYPENYLGNILQKPLLQMIKSKKQTEFGLKKRDALPQQCQQCQVRFACHGGCPKNRIATTPEGEPGLNYLCAGYKKFFKFVEPYMQFMAQELENKRPPANIMHRVKQKELEKKAALKPNKKNKKKTHKPTQKVGRNDPCPCGSGKKYKDCCRNK